MDESQPPALALDVNRLRILGAVVDSGSVTAAARTLGVSASAVSQQLSALERDIGRPLVERTSTGVVPTAAGEMLAARARQIADLLQETRDQVQAGSGALTGRVVVSSVASACVTFVSDAVQELGRDHPDLRVLVQSGEPEQSLAAVTAGRCDLAIVDEYDHVPLALPDDLESRELCADRLVAVAAPGVLPAGDAVRLAQLKSARWVMPPVTAACGQAVRTACRMAGFEPDVRCETDDLRALERLVAAGHGVAVLPRLAVDEQAAGIVVAPLNRPALRRRLILVVRRSAAARPSVRAVMETIGARAR